MQHCRRRIRFAMEHSNTLSLQILRPGCATKFPATSRLMPTPVAISLLQSGGLAALANCVSRNCRDRCGGRMFQNKRLVTHKHTGNLHSKYIAFTTDK